MGELPLLLRGRLLMECRSAEAQRGTYLRVDTQACERGATEPRVGSDLYDKAVVTGILQMQVSIHTNAGTVTRTNGGDSVTLGSARGAAGILHANTSRWETRATSTVDDHIRTLNSQGNGRQAATARAYYTSADKKAYNIVIDEPGRHHARQIFMFRDGVLAAALEPHYRVFKHKKGSASADEEDVSGGHAVIMDAQGRQAIDATLDLSDEKVALLSDPRGIRTDVERALAAFGGFLTPAPLAAATMDDAGDAGIPLPCHDVCTIAATALTTAYVVSKPLVAAGMTVISAILNGTASLGDVDPGDIISAGDNWDLFQNAIETFTFYSARCANCIANLLEHPISVVKKTVTTLIGGGSGPAGGGRIGGPSGGDDDFGAGGSHSGMMYCDYNVTYNNYTGEIISMEPTGSCYIVWTT